MKISKILQCVYVIHVIAAMVFIAYGNYGLGWVFWAIGMLLWAILFGFNVDYVEKNKSVEHE